MSPKDAFTLAETIINYLLFFAIIAVLAVLIFLQLFAPQVFMGRRRRRSTPALTEFSNLLQLSNWPWTTQVYVI